MPLYNWKDTTSGEQIEILRSFDEFQLPPTLEEVQKDLPDVDFEKAVWERVIGTSNFHLKGKGWASNGYS